MKDSFHQNLNLQSLQCVSRCCEKQMLQMYLPNRPLHKETFVSQLNPNSAIRLYNHRDKFNTIIAEINRAKLGSMSPYFQTWQYARNLAIWTRYICTNRYIIS